MIDYTPKNFKRGNKVIVTDIPGIGIVRRIHNKLLWVQYPNKKELEPVLYLNAEKVSRRTLS